MSDVGPATRFFQTTRGRILALLRRGAATVDDLAQAVGLTDNAVRLHLATLERDGLVRPTGTRRGDGAGKPATLYDVTPDAEALFSRAYGPVLGALLDELAASRSTAALRSLLMATGRRLGAGGPRSRSRDLKARVRAGAELLGSLGGDVRVERDGYSWKIRGYGCPLSSATSRCSEVCSAVAAALEEVIGDPVRECCERDERPRCCFVVGSAA